MNLVIGRNAIFHRQVPKKDGNGYELRPYIGRILDKVLASEKGNVIDQYLVQLELGGIELFTPDELSNFVDEFAKVIAELENKAAADL